MWKNQCSRILKVLLPTWLIYQAIKYLLPLKHVTNCLQLRNYHPHRPCRSTFKKVFRVMKPWCILVNSIIRLREAARSKHIMCAAAIRSPRTLCLFVTSRWHNTEVFGGFLNWKWTIILSYPSKFTTIFTSPRWFFIHALFSLSHHNQNTNARTWLVLSVMVCSQSLVPNILTPVIYWLIYVLWYVIKFESTLSEPTL